MTIQVVRGLVNIQQKSAGAASSQASSAHTKSSQKNNTRKSSAAQQDAVVNKAYRSVRFSGEDRITRSDKAESLASSLDVKLKHAEMQAKNAHHLTSEHALHV